MQQHLSVPSAAQREAAGWMRSRAELQISFQFGRTRCKRCAMVHAAVCGVCVCVCLNLEYLMCARVRHHVKIFVCVRVCVGVCLAVCLLIVLCVLMYTRG